MQNPFARAQFLTSCARLDQLPADDLPEVAFAGRSNAGKSSALNLICGQKGLARVSKTPGRTQMINLFEVPGGRFADLPGYGYADVPRPLRESWGELVGGYLRSRENLRGCVIIMDVRHPLTDHDRQMLAFARHRSLPCHVLLTKADKLGFGATKKTLLAVRADLGETASVQLFSASARTGLDEAVAKLQGWIAPEIAPQ